MEIKYELNGGIWDPKNEVKEAFYKELYDFVNSNYNTELKEIDFSDFVIFEPYIIGNMLGEYFLKEEVGGKLEDQPTSHFVGYLYHNNKYHNLLNHLIVFFALWRDIEGCTEEHATDFFAKSWASLVDTAKFFKYTTVEDLKNSKESPTVRDYRIIKLLQTTPDTYPVPRVVHKNKIQRLPIPKRTNYEFLGWYSNSDFSGEKLINLSKDIKMYYARWQTYTYFHSNDGYPNFDLLYTDFLNDFSKSFGSEVTKDTVIVRKHGPISDFCFKSFNGELNKFFSDEAIYKKWNWLIRWLQAFYKDEKKLFTHFDYKDGKFGLESQVRWELNSLFVSRFHLVWPETKDYSGIGIKEEIANGTNSRIHKVKYPVGENVELPIFKRAGYKFLGWYLSCDFTSDKVDRIDDDSYSAKTLYAKWEKE